MNLPSLHPHTFLASEDDQEQITKRKGFPTLPYPTSPATSNALEHAPISIDIWALPRCTSLAS